MVERVSKLNDKEDDLRLPVTGKLVADRLPKEECICIGNKLVGNVVDWLLVVFKDCWVALLVDVELLFGINWVCVELWSACVELLLNECSIEKAKWNTIEKQTEKK